MALRRRWRVLVACVALGLAASTTVTLLMEPSYRASAQLFVAVAGSATDGEAGSLNDGSVFTADRAMSYPGVVTSPRVLRPVVDELQLEMTVPELAERVSAQVPPNTVLIEVYADDPSADRAARIANAVSRNVIAVAEDLDRLPDGTSAVRVNLTREAVAPTTPRSPVPLVNLAFGLAMGLVAGVGGALLRDSLDSTVATGTQVHELTGLWALAEVPEVPALDRASELRRGEAGDVAWAEAYRTLCANLGYRSTGDPPRVVLVTSPAQGEGRSLTAASLASALARSHRRTVLVDADLRRPSVASAFGLEPEAGLSTVVSGQARLADVIQRARGFDVVTSGPVPPNPSEMLESDAFRGLVTRLREDYEAVVIDSSPLTVTDPAVVSSAADAVLLVCRCHRTEGRDLLAALASLRAVEARSVGVVLTGVALETASSARGRPRRQPPVQGPVRAAPPSR